MVYFLITLLVLTLEGTFCIPKPCGTRKCEEIGLGRPCHSYFDCRFKPEGIKDSVYFKCDGSRCLCELFGYTRDEFGEVTTMWDKNNAQCLIGQRGLCGMDNGIEVRCEPGYECVNHKCEKRPDLEQLTGCKNKNGCEFGREKPPCPDPEGCEFGRESSAGVEDRAGSSSCEASGSCEKPQERPDGWGSRGRPMKQKGGCQSGNCGSKKPKTCGEGSSCNDRPRPMRPTKKPCGEEGCGTKKPSPCGDEGCGAKKPSPCGEEGCGGTKKPSPCGEEGCGGNKKPTSSCGSGECGQKPMRPTSTPCQEKGGCGGKQKGGCGSGGCGRGSGGGSGGGSGKGSGGSRGGGSGGGFGYMRPRTTPTPRLPCGPENGCETEEEKKSPCESGGCEEKEIKEEAAAESGCGKGSGGCGEKEPEPVPPPEVEEPPCKKDNSCESENDSKGACDKCALFNFYRYTKDK